jgi:D-alanyl-D-alanine carboxypeptidase
MMNDETFNLSIRKFLKTVGVKSQHEIEQAVAAALAAKKISGAESFAATMNLKVPELGLNVQFAGTIELG